MHADEIPRYRYIPYQGQFETWGHAQRPPGIDRIEGVLPQSERRLQVDGQKYGHNRWQSVVSF